METCWPDAGDKARRAETRGGTVVREVPAKGWMCARVL